MIIIGVILLIAAWLFPSLGVPVPPPIIQLFTVGGWILIAVGIILLLLALLGRPVGTGWSRTGTGRRGMWY